MLTSINLGKGLFRFDILNYIESDHHVFPVTNLNNGIDIIFKSKDKKDRQWYYCQRGDYNFNYSIDGNNQKAILKLIYDKNKINRIHVDKMISRKYMVTDNSIIISRNRRIVMKQAYDIHGYKRIALKGSIVTRVHRLVAHAFCQKPEHLKDVPYDELQVNHKNSIRDDNYWANLEWCTAQENIIHSFKYGNAFGKKGEDNYISKFTNQEIKEIRNEWILKSIEDEYYTTIEHSNKYKIEQSNMRNILLNISYHDPEYKPDMVRLSKRKGERAVNASFKQNYIDLIRKDFGEQINIDQKYTFLKHAQKYKTPLTVMRNILLNLSYIDPNFIPYTFKLNNKSGIFNPRSKITLEDVNWIRKDYGINKNSMAFYSEKYKIGIETVRRIIKNESYHDPEYVNPIK